MGLSCSCRHNNESYGKISQEIHYPINDESKDDKDLTLVLGYLRIHSIGLFIPNDIIKICLQFFRNTFWTTITSILFSNKTDGMDCGIILIPTEQSIDSILNSTFKDCIQCKIPVFKDCLKQYRQERSNSYIIIQCGYIMAYKVYIDNNQVMQQFAKENNFIIIDSQKQRTQPQDHLYQGIFVNGVPIGSADAFHTELKKYGVAANLEQV